MTIVMANIGAQHDPLAGPAEAGDLFDETITRPGPAGTCGQSIYFGPAGADGLMDDRGYKEGGLRVDIDVEAGRAAVNWMADGSYAVELPPSGPLTVWWSLDAGPMVVPADKARVSVVTARRLVLDYVASGERPSGVDWTTG